MEKDNQFKQLEDAGFDVTPLVEETQYSIGRRGNGKQIVPRRIMQDALDDYLGYFDEVTSNGKRKDKRKVEFAKAVFIGDSDLIVDEEVGALYKPNRVKLLEELKDDSKKSVRELRKDTNHRAALEQAAIKDLRDLAISKKQRGQILGINGRLDSLELVLQKYNPLIYEQSMDIEILDRNVWLNRALKSMKVYGLNLPLGNLSANLRKMKRGLDYEGGAEFFGGLGQFLLNGISLPLSVPTGVLKGFVRGAMPSPEEIRSFAFSKDYELQVTKNPKLVSEAASSTKSACIKSNSLASFRYMLDDVGTIYFVGRENGKVRGYSRILIARNEDAQKVFSVDTIEPPGKDFNRYIGFVNALSLGAIQLAFDMGAKYVVSNDSRIKYGPREAFGNKRKKMTLTKIGKMPPRQYTTSFIEQEGIYVCETEPHVLMDNWRIEK